MYELMLLGFPRHVLLLILDDACVRNFEPEIRSPRIVISNCLPFRLDDRFASRWLSGCHRLLSF